MEFDESEDEWSIREQARQARGPNYEELREIEEVNRVVSLAERSRRIRELRRKLGLPEIPYDLSLGRDISVDPNGFVCQSNADYDER
jgi:hypothetical protein